MGFSAAGYAIRGFLEIDRGLPLRKGKTATMTHDYVRHGTTTLFAALSTLDGKVIGTCMPRHRHQEWIKFMQLIDTQTLADKELHLIVDNYPRHESVAQAIHLDSQGDRHS